MTHARILKTARALLGLSQEQLCAAAGISIVTLRRLEGRPDYADLVADATLEKVRAVLEERGAVFLEAGEVAQGPGVCVKAP